MTTNQATETKYMKRINYLRAMLTKYAHTWSFDNEPSARMLGWNDEYNTMRGNRELFVKYCAQHGSCTDHDASDLLC